MSDKGEANKNDPRVEVLQIPIYTPKDPGSSMHASFRQLELCLGLIGAGLGAATSEVQKATLEMNLETMLAMTLPPGANKSEGVYKKAKVFIDASSSMVAYTAEISTLVKEVKSLSEQMLKESASITGEWETEKAALLKRLREDDPKAFDKVFQSE